MLRPRLGTGIVSVVSSLDYIARELKKHHATINSELCLTTPCPMIGVRGSGEGMIYGNVEIDSIAVETPPVEVSSAEIERRLAPCYERLGLPEGRLELMTGIKSRRFWGEGFKPSDGAIAAGRGALEASAVPSGRIGALLMCSVCRDFLEPATACVVHDALGLPSDAAVFDVSNACLGVLTGMTVVADMIELGHIDAGMVVASENGGPLVESTIKRANEDLSLTRRTVKPLFASLTIGSGAVAVVLAKRGLGAGHRFVGGSVFANTRHNDLCRGNADKGVLDGVDTFMLTDSEELMRRGVETAAENWKKFKREIGWSDDTPDVFCAHQVGAAHRKLLFNALGIDLGKDFPILETWGNSGSVSCPTAFAMAVEDGRVGAGSKVALLGIGSGINCAMLGVEW